MSAAHDLVGAVLADVDFKPIFASSPDEGVYLGLTFQDGRDLGIWARGGDEGSAVLEIAVGGERRHFTDEQIDEISRELGKRAARAAAVRPRPHPLAALLERSKS